MRILHVASEVAPWAQTGGLADVVSALPPAIAALSSEIRTATVAPLYRAAQARLDAAGVLLGDGLPHHVVLGGHRIPVRLRPVGQDGGIGPRAQVWLLECPQLYDRGGFYEQPSGGDWPDNPLRFAVLSRAAVDLAPAILEGTPNVIHAHDWQAGLTTLFARQDRSSAATVFTIHNLGYRGLFDKSVMTDLGLPWSLFNHRQLEFWDQVSFLKSGMAFADAVTTVSPSYAEEILSPERGEGLDGFLRHDIPRPVGIVNGIDTWSWDPATDPALPARFSATDLSGKAVCREIVSHELGLALDDTTTLAIAIARMTPQKGLDLLADLVPELAALHAKLIILGAGDHALEQRLRNLGDEFPRDLAVRIGFDAALSRRLYAAADVFVMPSRFEPCGLGQLYAMRYGAVPVVANVGGLRDTVIDPGAGDLAGLGTGFHFAPSTSGGLRDALARATHLYRQSPHRFATLRLAGMLHDSAWQASADKYVHMYLRATKLRSMNQF